MALKIETSVLAGLATGTLVYGIYQAALPTTADIRTLEAQNTDVMKTEKIAAWTSAAVVSGVSLIAKDPTIFVIGGTVMVALSWMNRHANAVTPVMSAVAPSQTPRETQSEAPELYSAPTNASYGETI